MTRLIASAAVIRAPEVSKRSLVAIPGTPTAFSAFSTEWAPAGESQMAITLGPAPTGRRPRRRARTRLR